MYASLNTALFLQHFILNKFPFFKRSSKMRFLIVTDIPSYGYILCFLFLLCKVFKIFAIVKETEINIFRQLNSHEDLQIFSYCVLFETT